MTSRELEYVGFWPRVGASIVDTILLMLVMAPVLTFYYGSGYWLDTRLFIGPFDFFMNVVFPLLVVAWFWRGLQATPGKMLIGARVVDATTGKPLSVGQCVLRYFGYIISSLPLFIGYIWVAIDDRRQGWHDKLAKSVVVRARNREAAPVSFPGS